MNVEISMQSCELIKTLLIKERKRLMDSKGYKQSKKSCKKEAIFDKIRIINKILIKIGYKFKSTII